MWQSVLARVVDGEFARVVHDAPGARASLNRHPAAQPRVHLDVHAMPVVGRRTVFGGTRDEVVGPAERRRRDVKEVVDDISPRPRQPRVGRHWNAVGVVVGRCHRTVVDRGERGGQRGRCRHRVGVDERIEIPAVVSGFHRDAREDFLLHRDAELPVAGTHARAFHQVRIVGGGRRHQPPEVQVGSSVRTPRSGPGSTNRSPGRSCGCASVQDRVVCGGTPPPNCLRAGLGSMKTPAHCAGSM